MKDHRTFTIIPYKNKLLKLDGLVSGKIVFKNYYIDISTGKRIKENWKDWFETFEFSINTYFIQPKVVHLFYEFGFLINNIQSDIIKDDTILAIEINYKNFGNYRPETLTKIFDLLKINTPNILDYTKKFNEGREHLTRGNCYQFNLTEKFLYKLKSDDPFEVIDKVWQKNQSRGRYGSATYLPILNKLFFSNSPECLFQLEENRLVSRPIKGTMRLGNNIAQSWDNLINDRKNRNELFMIIDLIRNDLSSIESPKAKVVNKQAKLIVPGLIHQYGEIEVTLSDSVKVKRIIEKMFPGGSITGAPKKRSMEILSSLEKRERGFYCGSTIIFFKEMKAASINIRSAEIDFKLQEMVYSAGGGITIKSESLDEFSELSYKEKSFIHLLTL